MAVAANALVFGLAHLMFWNWVAVVLTVLGGAIFARAYRRRAILQAVLLHAVVFTIGLRVSFYHGVVGR